MLSCIFQMKQSCHYVPRLIGLPLFSSSIYLLQVSNNDLNGDPLLCFQEFYEGWLSCSLTLQPFSFPRWCQLPKSFANKEGTINVAAIGGLKCSFIALLLSSCSKLAAADLRVVARSLSLPHAHDYSYLCLEGLNVSALPLQRKQA